MSKLELSYCPACGSPVVMREAKYCELCGLDLYPIKKAMEKLRSRGTTISEQMEQLIAPKINSEDTEEEKAVKVQEFTDGNYAGKAKQLFEGINVVKDEFFAMECLNFGVKVGDAESELLAAKVEMEGLYNQKKNPKHAQELLLKLAQNNHSEAQFLLGKLLNDPSWYKKAAQQGHVEAMYKLGCHYAHKDNKNSADFKTAEEWLKMAIEKNHDGAAYELAYLYYENTPRIYESKEYAPLAFRYAKDAAEHDYKKAQKLLSYFYSEGYGCEPDFDQRDYWLDKSRDSL